MSFDAGESHSTGLSFDPSLHSLFQSSLGEVHPHYRVPQIPPNSKSVKATDLHRLVQSIKTSTLNVDSVPNTSLGGGTHRKRKQSTLVQDVDVLHVGQLYETDQSRSRKRKQVKVYRSPSEVQENRNAKVNIVERLPETHASIKPDTTTDLYQDALKKSTRTIFVGNIPSNAISSRTDYKTLKNVFSAIGRVESLRFRSVAFSEQIPRKAAFVNNKLHSKQRTVNAYVVYEEPLSARQALKLNGSVVLDRHIRVDSVAHPAKTDTKRCIFVGNLGFEAQEESLWTHFLPCGEVESVRIVRDARTNVGKGFGYVQFVDALSVDIALLLDGKKMASDRKLRITRARASNRCATENGQTLNAIPLKGVYAKKADPSKNTALGRGYKLVGRAGAAQFKRRSRVSVTIGGKHDQTQRAWGDGGANGKSKSNKMTIRSSAWKNR